MTREERLARLRELKNHYRDLDRQAKAAKQEHDQYEAELYRDMQSTNTFAIRQGDAHYVLKSTIFATVQDRDEFVEWCEANGMDEVLLAKKEEKARLNELVRAAIDNNEDIPPGVGFYAKEYISITES